MKKEIIKPTLALLLITLFSAAIMGIAYTVTKEPIRQQRANAEMAAISELLPQARTIEYYDIDEAGSSLTRLAIVFGDDNTPLGYVFSALPAGYSGRINMMVAFNPQGVIQGVRIINHTETPGLGSNITRDWFIGEFAGRSGIVASHDVPAIASATVSVNAVLRGVNDAVAYFNEKGGAFLD
jgi:electron transport complex protein RnfG